MNRTVIFSMAVIIGILLMVSNVFALSERSKTHLEDGVEFVPDVIIVAVFPDILPLEISSENGIAVTGNASLDVLNARFLVSEFRQMFPGAEKKGETELSDYYSLTFNNDFDMESVLEAYDDLADVEHVEPVGIHPLDYDPNDPQIRSQRSPDKPAMGNYEDRGQKRLGRFPG
jgi:hypothetical protein